MSLVFHTIMHQVFDEAWSLKCPPIRPCTWYHVMLTCEAEGGWSASMSLLHIFSVLWLDYICIPCCIRIKHGSMHGYIAQCIRVIGAHIWYIQQLYNSGWIACNAFFSTMLVGKSGYPNYVTLPHVHNRGHRCGPLA
jgi:hypothetical protein